MRKSGTLIVQNRKFFYNLWDIPHEKGYTFRVKMEGGGRERKFKIPYCEESFLKLVIIENYRK